MNGNTSTGRGAVAKGVSLDAQTNRLLAVMAGRFDNNRSMAVRAALRLAAKTWGITEDPPPQEGVT